jgi:hypothetical protein
MKKLFEHWRFFLVEQGENPEMEQAIQMTQQALGPMFGEAESLLLRLRSIGTPSADQQASILSKRVNSIIQPFQEGKITPQEAIEKFEPVMKNIQSALQRESK